MPLYLGTFTIAFASLALEVALTRLLSVVTWYHLAFFAISAAMLGMTAGGAFVYLRAGAFAPEWLAGALARSSLGFAFSTPLVLVSLCLMPLEFGHSIMPLVALAMATTLCALPFFFFGVTLSAVLARSGPAIGSLYAADLIGAAGGALFVLGALVWVDVPSLILLCAAAGSVAALLFAWTTSGQMKRVALWSACALTVCALLNSASPFGIQPLVVKGQVEDPGTYLIQRWHSFSRVVVLPAVLAPPQYWGASPLAPREPVEQYLMTIDGAAGTALRRFNTPENIEHLRFDVTNAAYHLRPKGGACVIGVGGGRDIQSALLFGHERVTGIDVNPIFIELLKGRFRAFAGVADRPGVTLVVDEARSHLARSQERWSVIQMSLIDTWAATGAGAFSLSENALYTEESWRLFFDHLTPDGLFTVSRWHSPEDLGETGRVVSLAVATLLDAGVAEPDRHLAMLATPRVATLLLSRAPFTEHDVMAIVGLANRMQFEIALAPGLQPRHPVLRAMLQAKSRDELLRAAADPIFNYTPPTDDSPYFFQMLRLRAWPIALNYIASPGASRGGVLDGNAVALFVLTALLLCLGVIALATIALPLAASRMVQGARAMPDVCWWAAAYFALIGAGFMFVEIGLIQRLSVLLGHPVYALGVLLCGIIAAAGFGSLLSGRLPLERAGWAVMLPGGAAALILAASLVSRWQAVGLGGANTLTRALASLALIVPVGLLLGLFFPMGMRLASQRGFGETPWYWAINGIFGVLASALAVFVSIHFGISRTFWISASCYAALTFCVVALRRMRTDNTHAAG
jgi:predicted membrane-bound spermidine synthase